MQVVGFAGKARAVLLYTGVGAIALGAAGAAMAQQGYYPGYPPPPSYAPGYDYPAPAPSYYGDPRYQDPRYADPQYAAPQYADPRYQDPRYMTPQQERAYRRWAARYYGQQRYAQPQEAPAYEGAPPPPAPPPLAPAVAPAVTVVPVAGPAQAEVPKEAPRVVREAEMVVPAPHLTHKLIEAATAYADFMHKATAINAGFTSGQSVATAVKTGSGYEFHQFEEGAVAYAALTALQEPSFVQGVRELLREGGGADFGAQLAQYPEAALNIRGADLAAARAAGALHKGGAHLFETGARVKQAAYDVQHAEWSKAQVSDPDARLALAKDISNRRAELKGDDAPELTQAVLAETQGERGAAPSPVVTRALAIAALAVLGQLKDGEDPNLNALLTEAKSADCLKMAKLNLYQCLSVSRPHYEDIFCLGEHAMMETGQCVVKASGFTPVPVTLAHAGGAAQGR